MMLSNHSGERIHSADWHPSGHYVAVGQSSSSRKVIAIYEGIMVRTDHRCWKDMFVIFVIRADEYKLG